MVQMVSLMTRAERRERKARAAKRAKMDVQVRVRMPETLKNDMEDLAFKRGKHLSEITREAFMAYLQKEAA